MARKKTVQPTSYSEPQIGTEAKLSLDLGNAYSNLRADANVVADWRSIIGRIGSANQLKGLPPDSVIRVDGVWYAFGEMAATIASATIEDYPTKDRYTSDWYRRLFSFALYKAYGMRLDQGVFYPRVISSIPASEFAIRERAAQIKERLVGTYELETVLNTCLHVVIKPENLSIIPEGVGSYYRMLSDGDNTSRYAVGRWGVVDFGYLTGDFVMLRDGNYVADKAISDSTVGVRQIADAVAHHIYANGGPDQDAHEYDRELNCDAIIANGRTFAIRSVVSDKIQEVTERINRFITKATSGQNMAGLIVSGGGADYFIDHIQSDCFKIKAPDPRRANVDGAYMMLSEE